MYVNPYLTSQTCHNCGELGARNGNKFQCSCGLLTHADFNASLNLVRIAEEEVSSVKEIDFSSVRGYCKPPLCSIKTTYSRLE